MTDKEKAQRKIWEDAKKKAQPTSFSPTVVAAAPGTPCKCKEAQKVVHHDPS